MTSLKLESFDDGLWQDRVGLPYATPLHGSSYGQHGDGVSMGDTVNGGSGFTYPLYVGEEWYLGFASKIVTAPSGVGSNVCWFNAYAYLQWDDAASKYHLYVRGGSDPNIDWYSAVVSKGDWHYLELHMEYGNNFNGIVEFWMDGTLINSDLAYDWYQPLSSAATFAGPDASDVDNMYLDNLYHFDAGDTDLTGPLGPIEVAALLPNGNGNSSDLVGQDSNSTDNYLNVDEATPDDGTTYNGGSTEGDHDTYAMENLTGTPTVVGAVASMYAAKTGSGPKFFRHIVRTADSLVDYTTTPTITSSSEFSTYTPDKAWRAVASYWVSAAVGSTEWWKADFGSAKNFGKVNFELYSGSSTYPTVVDLQYSDNDSDWYNAADQLTGVTATTYEVGVDSDVTSHRYWRLLFSSFSGSSGMEADNIYFYEVSATAADSVGTSVGLSTSYALLDEYAYELNPGTFKPWTYTTINSAEFGAEVRDS